jgi:hypothetical protein
MVHPTEEQELTVATEAETLMGILTVQETEMLAFTEVTAAIMQTTVLLTGTVRYPIMELFTATELQTAVITEAEMSGTEMSEA